MRQYDRPSALSRYTLAAAIELAPKLKERAGIADVSATLATLEQTMLSGLKLGSLVSPGWGHTGYVPYVPNERFLGLLLRHQGSEGRFNP